MPGHKGGRGASAVAHNLLGTAAFEADVSEVGGFDYLHAPAGALAAAQANAATLFGAERTWFLVNGSTVGNIAAICATVHDGDEILIARSSHRSVSGGLILSGATPVYLRPVLNQSLDGFFGVAPDDVARALVDHPNVRAVHITSPDYYGFASAVSDIAEIAHRRGVPLIVDEAHGTHFAFHPALPTSALAAGADVVVQSAHKTLGSLTQSSLLHTQGNLIDAERLAGQLQMLQSSSPSALLLLSLDLACTAMAADGASIMERTLGLAYDARTRIEAIAGLTLYGSEVTTHGAIQRIDPSKLVVDVSTLGVSAFAAAEWLRTHRAVNPEFADLRRMVFSITNGDDEGTVEVLVEALAAMATTLRRLDPLPTVCSAWSAATPQVILTPRQASQRPTVTVPAPDAAGRVAAEPVIPYPPGIPVLVPGEQITTRALEAAQQLASRGCRIVGTSDPTLATIRCIA